jgi:hypothetical protein
MRECTSRNDFYFQYMWVGINVLLGSVLWYRIAVRLRGISADAQLFSSSVIDVKDLLSEEAAAEAEGMWFRSSMADERPSLGNHRQEERNTRATFQRALRKHTLFYAAISVIFVCVMAFGVNEQRQLQSETRTVYVPFCVANIVAISSIGFLVGVVFCPYEWLFSFEEEGQGGLASRDSRSPNMHSNIDMNTQPQGCGPVHARCSLDSSSSSSFSSSSLYYSRYTE